MHARESKIERMRERMSARGREREREIEKARGKMCEIAIKRAKEKQRHYECVYEIDF